MCCVPEKEGTGVKVQTPPPKTVIRDALDVGPWVREWGLGRSEYVPGRGGCMTRVWEEVKGTGARRRAPSRVVEKLHTLNANAAVAAVCVRPWVLEQGPGRKGK